ncbi:MAG: response regulator [bacterium]
MKIKLFAGFGFILMVMTMVVILSIYQLSGLNKRLNNIVDNTAQKIILSEKINRLIVEIGRAEKNFLLSRTQAERDSYANFIDLTIQELNNNKARLHNLLDSEDKEELNEFEASLEKYLLINQQLRNLMKSSSDLKTIQISTDAAGKEFNLAAQEIDNIAREAVQEAEKARDLEGLRMALARVKLAGQLNQHLAEIQRDEKSMILSFDLKEMQEYDQAISEKMIEVDELLSELDQVISPAGKEIVANFKKYYGQYIHFLEQVKALALENADIKAFELSAGQGRELLNKAQAIIDALVTKGTERLTVDRAESDRQYIMVRNIKLIFLILSIMAGTLVAWLIVQGIIARARRLSEKAGRIALGQPFREEKEDYDDELSPIFFSLQRIFQSFANITRQAQEIAKGNFSTCIELRSPEDELGLALQQMTESLRSSREESEQRAWLRIGQNQLDEAMRGDQSILGLCQNIMSCLAGYLDIQIGALYLASKDTPDLVLCGSYAFDRSREAGSVIKIGEGLVGQAALEKKMTIVTNVPEDYARIHSATGEALPRHILVSPFLFGGKLKGVMEFGSFREFSDLHLEFLRMVMDSVAIGIHTAQSRTKIQELLEESQRMTDELQVQQEELQATNEELEEQTQNLRESQEKLKIQQEELQTTNEELEEKTESLERQKSDINRKNEELEAIRRDLEQKAEELAVASKYKSEFLANMSHELRTPLNSLLILSRSLIDNKDVNLTDHQIESLKIIYSSGKDLLDLINEILDLSKIEAGRMEVDKKELLIQDLAENIKAGFQHMIDDKRLAFQVIVDPKLPQTIFTDRRRTEQIMKNLMSNAIKFTDEGKITVQFKRPDNKVDLSRSGLTAERAVAISITDTGTGIPPDKQKIIFEAFQQADGGTARKYGGTGLGLSICRELADLLGGEIQLTSEPGKGSTFTLFLPVKREEKPSADIAPRASRREPKPAVIQPQDLRENERALDLIIIPDDRDSLKEDDQAILIIEDDQPFARILMDQCHQKGFKCLLSATGEKGLELAAGYQPKAIILDLILPGMNGWQVLESLKNNTAIRHIPVHIISIEEKSLEALQKGAIGFITKPVDKEELEEAITKIGKVIEKDIKDLLVVEDNRILRERIVTLIGNGDVKVSQAENGDEAIKALQSGRFDCMILDLGLPDMSGFELLRILETNENMIIPPVIIYTGRELTREEDEELQRYAESIIVKGVKSEERLLDETALFLHRIISNLPEKKKKMITTLYDKDMVLQGKKILLVDDDMRNAFALARILQDNGMKVLKAEDGKKALNILDREPDVDLVLMDIMMPVMDGYEATRTIRAHQKFWNMPIIALTAKAMKEDRARCLAAGASDYITKPVEVDRLLSMMRVLLYR